MGEGWWSDERGVLAALAATHPPTCPRPRTLAAAAAPTRDGQQVVVPPVSNPRVVDFGAGVGRRSVYLYNLPEVGGRVGRVGGCSGGWGEVRWACGW